MRYLPVILLTLTLQSCFLRPPSLTLTDQYIQLKNPGQSWALMELKEVKLDSIFGYPKQEVFVKSYIIVKTKDGRKIRDHSKIKLYFNNSNRKYQWKHFHDFTLQQTSLSDSIALKPFTWYSLSSSKASYELYLYSKGTKGDYIVKEKPNPGAW